MKVFSPIFSQVHSRARSIDLAVELGTSSVSAVFATASQGEEHKTIYEVGQIYTAPFDLLTFSHGAIETRAWHVVHAALSQTFADLAATRIRPREIRIGLASLFFKECTVEKNFQRERPDQIVTRAEIAQYQEIAAREATMGKEMQVIHGRLLKTKINGYRIEDPVGYTGAAIQCSFQFLFIGQALYAHFSEVIDKHFPHIPVVYYSDADVLMELIRHTSALLPLLLMDIGGEATSCYALFGDRGMVYYPPLYFGVRTLERRIAAFLRAEIADAESLLRRFTAGTLHEDEWEKIQPTVETAMTDWWATIKHGTGGDQSFARIYIAGAGRNMVFFGDTLKKEASSAWGVQPEHIGLLDIPADRFIPQKVFGFGGDMVLGGLLLADEDFLSHEK